MITSRSLHCVDRCLLQHKPGIGQMDLDPCVTDEPPPLEDMSKFIGQLRLTKDLPEWQHPKTVPAIPTKVSDTTTLVGSDVCKKSEDTDIKEPFKRGFLNSSYGDDKTNKNKKKQDIPFLKVDKKAKKSELKEIPDFLRVKLEDSPREMLRKEIIDMLEPTTELVKDVMENEAIKSGLEDPEIMFAVQQIAGNPDSIQKYKNNPKVGSFYSELGRLMGDKIRIQEAKKNP